MLSFAVFDDAGPAREWPLTHAFLVGPGNSPVPAEIEFLGGVIRCEKRAADAAGISLLFPVEPIQPAPGSPAAPPGARGVLMLQTCLLPERPAPYLLSVELARHRLMLVINKLEDWALFDLPPEDLVLGVFERARLAFTEAVTAQGSGPGRAAGEARGYSQQADRLGREALALALEASELLAVRQARLGQERRYSGELVALAERYRPPENALTEHETRESINALTGTVGVILPAAPLIGCTVSPDQSSPALQQAVQSTCDFLCMPMRWVEMEPNEGRYTFTPTDKWIEWAVRTAKIPVVGGPVIDFRSRCVPEWMYIWEHDYETLRELVYEYVKNIVTRYRRTVGTWTAVSGLNVNGNLTRTIEQMMDLTRVCVALVRKLQPNAVVQVEVDQPWGEYHGANPRSMPPMMYAEVVSQAAVNADVIGLRIQMGQPEEKAGKGYGRPTRDLMALSALLDEYAELDKPIAVTALGAPSRPTDPAAGFWRRPWSPEAQADWVAATTAIIASKPYVKSICWQELCDTARLPGCDGLVGADGQPKLAIKRLAEVRQSLREKRVFPVL
ncbi:MAG: endo-1,4-beta-xylanase [Phycisphaerales bacterium]|nr:endo-1,4-beta-xylanase [Phycisphaerales bacterium]